MKENLRTGEISGGEPIFKFVYALHDGPINGRRTWDELKVCDVILLEEIGLTEKKKTRSENGIQKATSQRWTPVGFFERLSYMAQENKSWGMYIISQAIKTGKEFHFIDIRDESPIHGFEKDAKSVYISAFDEFRKGRGQTALNLLSEGIDKFALYNSERTRVIIKQIEDFTATGRYRGKKIGIAQGAGHQATWQTFQKKHPEYQTFHAVVFPGTPTFLILNAMVKRELDPYGDVDKRDCKDILLSTGLLYPYLCVSRPNENPVRLSFLADKVVQSLDSMVKDTYWNFLTESALGQDEMTSKFLRVAYIMALNFGLEKPALQHG